MTIRGEVQRPGTYPLFKGMTAAELVRTAGGFKRDALIQHADLASYRDVNGERVSIERRDVAIGSAVLKRDPDADTSLRPGDVLTIHQLTGWNDIGASIALRYLCQLGVPGLRSPPAIRSRGSPGRDTYRSRRHNRDARSLTDVQPYRHSSAAYAATALRRASI